MFAIIKIQGKQYLVSQGEILEVGRMPVKKDEVITFDEVLAYNNDKEIKIGQPRVSGAKVTARVLEPKKLGKKVEVIKFKPKKRYLKRKGFRPQFTVLQIQEISLK